MIVGTVLELIDVRNRPKVRLDLPYPLRIGDRITVSFCLQERFNGRLNVLEVQGDVRVVSVSFDATNSLLQKISVEAADGQPFVWKSVKSPRDPARPLGPAKQTVKVR